MESITILRVVTLLNGVVGLGWLVLYLASADAPLAYLLLGLALLGGGLAGLLVVRFGSRGADGEPR
ncbi:hypothetical protein [Modestobacter sp. SYSU DS0290]